MPLQYVPDTNVFLHNPHLLDDFEEIVVLNHILRELDKLKLHKNKEVAYKSRVASRYIDDNLDRISFDFKDYIVKDERLDSTYEDNKIIQACIENNYSLLSFDRNMKHIAMGYGVNVIELKERHEPLDTTYKGYKEVILSKEELDQLYQNLEDNRFDLMVNQYLIILDEDGKDVDALKWDGECLKSANSKGFSVNAFGKFKPKDFYQRCAVDSIVNNDITMLKGKAGAGKSLIGLYTLWHLIERGKLDRLIVFTNPVKTRNAEALGFYKGDRTQKLLDSQTGIMLGSKFGDQLAVEMQINHGILTLLPFSDIRGFDTTAEKKTAVWIPEAQNLNTDLLKLGLQRLGDGTKVVVDGDPNAQVDMDIYRSDNGMNRMSEVFRGYESYGEIELKHIYRSRTAEIAEDM